MTVVKQELNKQRQESQQDGFNTEDYLGTEHDFGHYMTKPDLNNNIPEDLNLAQGGTKPAIGAESNEESYEGHVLVITSKDFQDLMSHQNELLSQQKKTLLNSLLRHLHITRITQNKSGIY